MTVKTSSSFIGDGIFATSYSVKMTDLVDVLTYSRYLNEYVDISIVSEPNTQYGDSLFNSQDNEFTALFINKSIHLDSPIASYYPSNKTGYAIAGEASDLRYLNFYLNTFVGKYELSSRKPKSDQTGTTTLTSIKNLEIIRNKKIEPYCVYLQNIITKLPVFLDKDGADEQIKLAVTNCFTIIGDSIMMELHMPKVFAEYDLSLIQEWMKLVDSVSTNKDIHFQIRLLIKALFSINSPIMDSINRMKTFSKVIIDTFKND